MILVASRRCDLGKHFGQQNALERDGSPVIAYRDGPLWQEGKLRSGETEITF
jgi:hypothetical protein